MRIAAVIMLAITPALAKPKPITCAALHEIAVKMGDDVAARVMVKANLWRCVTERKPYER